MIEIDLIGTFKQAFSSLRGIPCDIEDKVEDIVQGIKDLTGCELIVNLEHTDTIVKAEVKDIKFSDTQTFKQVMDACIYIFAGTSTPMCVISKVEEAFSTIVHTNNVWLNCKPVMSLDPVDRRILIEDLRVKVGERSE